MIHDDTVCLLGEGALWHPGRAELFWFDILGRRLHARGRHWSFDDWATAAGWLSQDTLLVATSRALIRLDLATDAREDVAPLDPTPGLRANDGRADPHGGFWIGTMSLGMEPEAGAIWRYYRGELRKLYPGIGIPNAICFSEDGLWGHFTDSTAGVVYRVRLSEADGWPAGEPEPVLDLGPAGRMADGAVIAADGSMWIAQWGSGRVASHAGGVEVSAIDVPAMQTTCPAFGGPEMKTLFVTSAAVGLSQADLLEHPRSGQTFAFETGTVGRPEPQVIL